MYTSRTPRSYLWETSLSFPPLCQAAPSEALSILKAGILHESLWDTTAFPLDTPVLGHLTHSSEICFIYSPYLHSPMRSPKLTVHLQIHLRIDISI